MRAYLNLVLLILAVVSIGYAIIRVSGRAVNNRMTDSVRSMALILGSFDALDDREIFQSGAFWKTEATGLVLNRRIANLFTHTTNTLAVAGSLVSKDGIFRDAWGTPLQFLLTNDTNYSRVNDTLRKRSRPFVVWSSGANGSNEFGFGDDVFSYR